MCDPPCLSPSPDCLAWPLRIAVLGKRLSGKSTQIDFIAQNHKVKGRFSKKTYIDIDES